MSVFKQRNSWICCVIRGDWKYNKRFDSYEEAKEHEKEILKIAPPKQKSGPRKGCKQKDVLRLKQNDERKILMNGCELYPTIEGRCHGLDTCKHFESCFDRVANTNWQGFAARPLEAKKC